VRAAQIELLDDDVAHARLVGVGPAGPRKGPWRQWPQEAADSSISQATLGLMELHNLPVRVLTLAARAEGTSLPQDSRTIRAIYEALSKIDDIVRQAEPRIPLAVARDGKGRASVPFTVDDVDRLKLHMQLSPARVDVDGKGGGPTNAAAAASQPSRHPRPPGATT